MTTWTDDEVGGSVWSEDEAAGTALGAATGSSLVGFVQSGTGATARTVEAKLRERCVSVKDFGAVGDGVTNDKAAIILALAASKHVYFPQGTYNCGTVTDGNPLFTADGDTGKLTLHTEGYVKLICASNGVDSPQFFRVIDANGVKIGTFHFEDSGYDNDTGTKNGAIAFLIEASSSLTLPVKNVDIDAIYCKSMGAALLTQGNSTSVRVEGIHVGLIYCDNTYYGYNAQNNGDAVTIDLLYAKEVKRSYIVYGVKGHRVNIYSTENPDSTGDVNISCNTQSVSTGPDTEDLDIRYTCRDPVNDFTTGAESGALVNLNIFKEDTKTIRNVRLWVDIDSPTSSNVDPITFRVYNSDGTRNTSTTNNTFQDIVINGRISAPSATNDIDLESQPSTRGWLTLGAGINLGKVSSAVKTYFRLASPLRAPQILAQSGAAVSVSNTTSEETLATITVPANAMGANGALRIWTSWTITNGANDKTLIVRFSGTGGTAYLSQLLTNTLTAQYVTTITNRNATNSQVGGSGTSNIIGSNSGGAIPTSAVDTTADTTIVIRGTKEVGTEVLTLERYLVELIYQE